MMLTLDLNSQKLRKIREQKEKFVLPLSKIESGKRICSCYSRKSRVERELFLATLENREQKEKWELSNYRDRERNFSFYSRFFSRERDSCQCLDTIAHLSAHHCYQLSLHNSPNCTQHCTSSFTMQWKRLRVHQCNSVHAGHEK